MARRVFDVDDETATTTEVKADQAVRTRAMQEKRRAKNRQLLKKWETRLKRATNECRKRVQREFYYASVLGDQPAKPKPKRRRRRKKVARRGKA